VWGLSFSIEPLLFEQSDLAVDFYAEDRFRFLIFISN